MQSVTKGIASEKTILVPLELPKNTCKTPKSSVPVLSVSFLKPVLQNPGFPRVLRISGQLLWSSGAPMLARCMADRGVGFRVAGGDDDDSYSARKLTTLGCKHVSILHTRDPAVADSDQKVLKMLDEANGIWIDGGRTYRVMEAYENTQVQKKIYAILQRVVYSVGVRRDVSWPVSFLSVEIPRLRINWSSHSTIADWGC